MIQLVLFKSNGGKNMKVLIADDEQDMLRILKAYFEKEGFEVLLAKDGEEALQMFYDEKIDLAILD